MHLLSSSDIRRWFVHNAKGRVLEGHRLTFVFTDHRRSDRLERLVPVMPDNAFPCNPINYDADGEAFLVVRSRADMDEDSLLKTNSRFREMAGKYRVSYLGVQIADNRIGFEEKGK